VEFLSQSASRFLESIFHECNDTLFARDCRNRQRRCSAALLMSQLREAPPHHSRQAHKWKSTSRFIASGKKGGGGRTGSIRGAIKGRFTREKKKTCRRKESLVRGKRDNAMTNVSARDKINLHEGYNNNIVTAAFLTEYFHRFRCFLARTRLSCFASLAYLYDDPDRENGTRR